MKKVTFLILLFFSIAKIQSQNYLISFTATGSTSSIDSVRVENLTQSTSLTILGNDDLNLVLQTSINEISLNEELVQVSPNPMQGQTEISFYAKQAGESKLAIYDVSGKEIIQIINNTPQGNQKYQISGLKQGVYFLIIKGANYLYSSKLVSINTSQNELNIQLIEMDKKVLVTSSSKGVNSTVNMTYAIGDNLRLTAYSTGCYKTVTDIPTSSKTIPFDFAATAPNLSTITITNLESNSVTSGGNVISDGGCLITNKGVCWSLTSNPTINDSITNDGIGSDLFTSYPTNLLSNTNYYLRAYATNNVGTAYGEEVFFRTQNLEIGQSYKGGIIAYILQPGDPGYVNGQEHGLIAAPNDQIDSIQWYNGSFTLIGTADSTLGKGSANTDTIVAHQGDGAYAAKICFDLILNTYSDWYLPSKHELEKLYLNRILIGNFNGTYYWSSSEYSSIMSFSQDFSTGISFKSVKQVKRSVRAIRAF